MLFIREIHYQKERRPNALKETEKEEHLGDQDGLIHEARKAKRAKGRRLYSYPHIRFEKKKFEVQ